MPLKVAAVLGLLLVSFAARGERLPTLRVNGVSIEVTRIAGDGLPAQVQAIETGWRQSGSEVSPWQEEGSWRVLSRRVGRWSEVLQIRQGGPQSEAYLSRLDAQQKPAPVPVIPLPPGCRANSTVESNDAGMRVIQVSGPCRGMSEAATSAWTTGLAAQGWRGGPLAGRGGWRFQRGGDVLQVQLGPGWVMALQIATRGIEP